MGRDARRKKWEVSISIVSIVLFVSRNIPSANRALTGLQIVSFCISVSVNPSIHPGDPAGWASLLSQRKAEGDAFNQQVENTQLSKSLSNCESIGFWWYERACSNILFGCFVLPYHNVTPERGQRSHFSLSHRAETIAQSSFLETVHGLNVICLCDIEEIHHMEYLIGSISCWAHLANIPFLIRLQMLSC